MSLKGSKQNCVGSSRLSAKVLKERYGAQMGRMTVGNVLYVNYYGARARIQRTGLGEMDYHLTLQSCEDRSRK